MSWWRPQPEATAAAGGAAALSFFAAFTSTCRSSGPSGSSPWRRGSLGPRIAEWPTRLTLAGGEAVVAARHDNVRPGQTETMADTAIFDVDGTLVDTNYQH